MAKFSLNYVKKNPVMFGGIIIVFGLLLWLLMSGRGGGAASGGGTVVSSGPSEALQAQAMQVNAGVQTATLQANAALQSKQIEAAMSQQRGALELEALTRNIEGQENLALMQQQYMIAELESNRALSSEQTAASLAALQTQMSYSLAQTESNNQAMIDYASVAADSATTQLAINAALQRDLSSQQLEAYKYGADVAVKQASLSAIGMLKKKDRDTALGAFFASNSGQGFTGGKGDDRISFMPSAGYLPSGSSAVINPNSWGVQ